MRIVIDLDGTICTTRENNDSYADVKPIPGAIDTMKRLKENGHEIIIYTSRHMQTCQGNPGKAIANIGKITLDWLDYHDIPYDEIIFGKPIGDVYIDDKAIRFHSWSEVQRNWMQGRG